MNRKEKPRILLHRIIKIIILRSFNMVYKLRNVCLKIKKKDRIFVCDVEGSKMFLDTHDDNVSTKLYYERIHEPYATMEISSRLKEGMVIADIGSNVGYYALMEAKAVGDKGRVYAIEPLDSCMNLLKKSFDINNYNNVDFFDCAIGKEDGTAKLYVLSNKPSRSNLFGDRTFDFKNKYKPRKVKLLTLDSCLKGKKLPDVIRMDIESGELNVLKGMTETAKHCKQMWIEVHSLMLGKEKTKEVLQRLKDFGFVNCRVGVDAETHLEVARTFLSPKVVPQNLYFSGHIDDLIKDERFYKIQYHLFITK